MRFLHKKSEVFQCWTCAPLGCARDNILDEVLAKFLQPLVHFHCWKKMIQIILSLIGLSVCLISLCSSLIGLCAYLISLSQKKPISTGSFWEKLVENAKLYPIMFTFFTNICKAEVVSGFPIVIRYFILHKINIFSLYEMSGSAWTFCE